MIRSIPLVVIASVITASCSGSSEVLPTSTEQVVSATTAATTTTEAPTETTEELVERLGGAVVRLDVAACDGEYVGAGFLIDEHHIVTVAHNVIDAQLIAATIGDEIAIAEPVGMDVLRDIALLRTDIPMGDVYFELEGSEPVVGQDLILFGFPLGLDLTVTRGIVSNADVELPEEPLLRFVQIDAAANPGNSGGPVVTADGDLIGILQSGIVGFEGLNFATKLTVVERLLNSWIDSPGLPAVDCGDVKEEDQPVDSGTTQTTAKPTTSGPSGTASTTVVTDSGSEVTISASIDWGDNTLSVRTIVDDPDGVNPTSVIFGTVVNCPLTGREVEGSRHEISWECAPPTDSGPHLIDFYYTDDLGNAYREMLTIEIPPKPSTTTTVASSTSTTTSVASSTTTTTQDPLAPTITEFSLSDDTPCRGGPHLTVQVEATDPSGISFFSTYTYLDGAYIPWGQFGWSAPSGPQTHTFSIPADAEFGDYVMVFSVTDREGKESEARSNFRIGCG